MTEVTMEMKLKVMKSKSINNVNHSGHSSLINRAGQIMIFIITLSLISMISSILVTESLSGDAKLINHAGELRMQIMKISRADLIKQQESEVLMNEQITLFERKLQDLFANGLANMLDDKNINDKYEQILTFSQQMKSPSSPLTVQTFDQFVVTIDQLVTLIQQKSETKLSWLKLILGISLLALIIVAATVLFKINRVIIKPLRQLIDVALKVGKGNFETKAEYSANNELGLLATSINEMSQQLKSTYQDFEENVAHKTRELTRSNRTLEILYRAARDLSIYDFQEMNNPILTQFEEVIGFGKISIELNEQNINRLIIKISSVTPLRDNFCFNNHQFSLTKQNKNFGYLVWQFPKHKTTQTWQMQILRVMADIIATAIQLEQKKHTEDILLIAEERAVIARELHDSLAQSLSYLKVQMSVLTRKIQKEVPREEVTETIEDTKLELTNAYLHLRELLTTFRLKPDDPSIENSLQSTIAEFSEKCNHPIDLSFKIPQNYLSANQEIHVLQIIREALSNVQRHAEATHSGIIVKLENNNISIVIWDNGKGFDHYLLKQGHFGLSIMKERAKSLNAAFDIQTRKPNGTSINIEFQR